MTSRLPLRTQVLLLLLGTVLLVVATSAVAGTAALRSYLLARVDDQVASTAQAYARGVPPPAPDGDDDDGDGDGRRGPGRRGGGSPAPLPREFLVALYDEAGRPTAYQGLSPDADAAPRLPAAGDLPRGPFTLPARRGDVEWRAVAGTSPLGTVVVALPLTDVQDTVQRLLLIDLAVGALALAGAGLLGVVGVRRSLAPLVRVEETAEAIAAGDLSVRVPEADPRTEVGSLSSSFNVMVDRFESAYRAQQASEAQARASEERMRRFIGDASHELRTPLTSIRGFAELFRQGAVSDPDGLARVMGRIEDEAARMGLLVEDLLLLARLDQQRPLEQAPVDLLSVAADVVHDAQVVRSAHAVVLAPPRGSAPPVVLGDDARLRQVVTNLVTNATTHTPAGTRVDVAVHRDGDEVVLSVADEGPGMPPEVAARVFERFYRADASRSRGPSPTSGSGLGLSIVAALVAAHGGTIDVDSRPGAGTAFTVRLPALRGVR